MNSTEDQCSICWDKYKLPKLLQCRHTFCCTCLKSYTKRTRGRSEISCPLCRQVWWLPESGVTGFLNNYFVEDVTLTEQVEPAVCDSCRGVFILQECSHCAQKMCCNCSLSHKEALKVAGESNYARVFDKKEEDESDSDSSSADDNSDDESGQRSHRRRDSYVSVPFSLFLGLPTIKTKFKVNQVSVIGIESRLLSSDHTFINCIQPVSETECLVIPFAGPEIFHYNFQGEVRGRTPLHGGIITSVLRRHDGSLLVSLWKEKAIICVSDNLITGFYNTGDFNPHSMAMFPDGRVVFVGPCGKHVESDDGKWDLVKSDGTCHIISKDGRFLQEIKNDSHGDLFENPSSVAISPTTSTLAVADRGKKCVYMFLEDGGLMSKYQGSRQRFHFLTEDINFMPLNVCFDRNGNLLIADAAHRIIHVLDGSGDFIGLIASQDGDFGRPFSLAVDFGGRIWIGDELDRTIKVFEIENYINCFPAYNDE